jgi:hypothetical protein
VFCFFGVAGGALEPFELFLADQKNLGSPMNLTEYIDSKRDENLSELKEFLRIPSVSTKSEHKPDVERAAEWVAGKLRGAGL